MAAVACAIGGACVKSWNAQVVTWQLFGRQHAGLAPCPDSAVCNRAVALCATQPHGLDVACWNVASAHLGSACPHVLVRWDGVGGRGWEGDTAPNRRVLALALTQDIKDPKLVHKLSLHKVEVQAVAFSCDGARRCICHGSETRLPTCWVSDPDPWIWMWSRPHVYIPTKSDSTTPHVPSRAVDASAVTFPGSDAACAQSVVGPACQQRGSSPAADSQRQRLTPSSDVGGPRGTRL